MIPLPLFFYALFASRLALTAKARSLSTVTVSSQLMQASVIDTPFLSPATPSAGTSWRPSLILLSIMTPMMPSSPARSCSAIEAATSGWFCMMLVA